MSARVMRSRRECDEAQAREVPVAEREALDRDRETGEDGRQEGRGVHDLRPACLLPPAGLAGRNRASRPSMLTFPWSMPDRLPALPGHTRRLVEAVRTGRGGDLFPPVIRICPEGVEAPARELDGARDAGLIA